MEFFQFTRIEHQVLVLCARIHLSEPIKQEVSSLLATGKVDVNYLIILAKKHKVLQLIAEHLIELDVHSHISDFNKYLMNNYYLGIRRINEIIFKEFELVLSVLNAKKLKAIPLKGSQLVPMIYKDYGLRTLNDIDFLISLEDRQVLSDCLKSLGYKMGVYNWSTCQVDSISREEELLWKMHIGNLYPHTKKFEDNYCKYLSIDFSYDVDLQKNFNASRLLIERAAEASLLEVPVHLLHKTDFLIHLCIHLYKEATNVQWVLYHNDLNLIKFCDIREYLLSIFNDIDPEYLCARIAELSANEAVFYSFYYLDRLFGETFSEQLLGELNILDHQYLEKYGVLDYGAPREWRKGFYDRFFGLSNEDELTETSKLEKLKNEQLTEK